MAWFGKLIGGIIGSALGGPIGAIIGISVGHLADKSSSKNKNIYTEQQETLQLAYFATIFTLLAKVAKADGKIQEVEGKYFLQILDQFAFDKNQRQFAVNIFNTAAKDKTSHKDIARQFVQINREHNILFQVYHSLVNMAAVDKVLTESERALLNDIALIFELSSSEIRQAYAMWGFDSDTNAYSILGLDRTATTAELRAKYRTLVKENHPDILASKGLPPEMLEKTQQDFILIQKAWEQIQAERQI